MPPSDCEIVGLERAQHTGVAVVIDVIRAFTTAATAFAAGAERIVCVEGVDEALALRESLAESLAMGEERGDRPPGFDIGNSPVELDGRDLRGVTVVQRTSNGTRGLLWSEAPVVLAAAAVNASATAAFIRRRHPGAAVRLVCTGLLKEDEACARYLADVVSHGSADSEALRAAVVTSFDEHVAVWGRRRSTAYVDAFRTDTDRCAEVDRYDFAMVGERYGSTVTLQAVRP